MKYILTLSVLFFFTSFSKLTENKMLPNGNYLMIIDPPNQGHKEKGFEVTVNDDVFMINLRDFPEICELEWIDEKSFVAKGYSEPKNPTKFEQEMIVGNNRPIFTMLKKEKDTYFFKLATKADMSQIMSGKFVKVK